MTTAEHLADSLGDSFTRTDHWASLSALFQPLLELLATGQPVSTDDLAAATGQEVAQVRDLVATLPGVELDDTGRIVGYGLTQRPTPHTFEVNDHKLYTWCALDTLIFPILLGHPAHVTSPCHTTGTPVELTVEPDTLTSIQPATTAVSIVTPADMTDVRAAFCHDVHFFASAQAAEPWLNTHPNASVLPVSEAFTLARKLAVTLVTDISAEGCC